MDVDQKRRKCLLRTQEAAQPKECQCFPACCSLYFNEHVGVQAAGGLEQPVCSSEAAVP